MQAFSEVGKPDQGDALRRFLLLAALCMALAFVLSTPAMAQADLDCGQLSEAEEQAVFEADPSDPNGLDEDDDGLPCEDDTTDDGSFALPTDEDDPEPDDDQYGVDEEQYDAETPATSPTTVSPTAAESTPGASALPETGGASPALLSVMAGIVLVGAGIASAAVARRT